MIPLEQLLDGSVSARNFDTLRSLVIDTGGQSVGIRFGSVTLTWPGGSVNSATFTVDHGLAKTPVAIVMTPIAAATPVDAFVVSSTVGDTSFGARGRTTDGSSPAAGATATVYWILLG